MAKKRKADPSMVHELLRKEFGEVSCPLHYSKPHELAIAVILSAQCTDERVNTVTPSLFLRYPTLKDFSNASPDELEKLIYSTGFYKNKAKSIRNFATKLLEDFGGELPKTIQELTTLPGIGRKTANVILNEIYKISEGIVVDTHVKRISRLLGYTRETDPEKIEQNLMKIIPEEHWLDISLYLIFLGRKYCIANRPNCRDCVLNTICPTAG